VNLQKSFTIYVDGFLGGFAEFTLAFRFPRAFSGTDAGHLFDLLGLKRHNKKHARPALTAYKFFAAFEPYPRCRSHPGNATWECDTDQKNDHMLQEHSTESWAISVRLHSSPPIS
jgi:hypothetical protein